ncbi:oligopeptide:H+ symporter [Reichenbachiella agarivorans]|uniref:Oligopeptide:H+ symporter n=1 Tax=Reichenbachiella agarivorans TaxID=2979464 RepID=A0ABY6CQM6_9BACT|nr:oligopeptide:H+ symporter [Reichenbachiella agarivorans]UXP31663.1 oligopeptide:H+ symporter [Reichenbachiella agarivorans]
MNEVREMETPQFLGHPKGLFYLFFAELWERFSFYGMRALLMVYMTEEVYRSLVDRDTIAATIYAAYGALVYATPVLGGMLADRLLGYRRAIMLGGVLMALGHFVLAIDDQIAFFLALALIIVGNGLFKPNISSFVGSLYEQGDPRRDSGFTIFYMGINIGAFVAPLLCGWLGFSYGWHYGFGAAGIGMLAGVIVFYSGIKGGIFGVHGHAPNEDQLEVKISGLKIKNWVPLIAFALVPFIALIMYYGELYLPIVGKVNYEGQVVEYAFYLILIVILGVIVRTMTSASKVERQQLLVIVLLTMFMTMFWGGYELSGSTLTLFALRNVEMIGINASQANSITGLYIIMMAVLFSWIWVKLSAVKANPYTPFKFAFGLLLLGAGFAVFAWSGSFANDAGKVPMLFLMLGYLMFSTGELFMSPVGLSKVTELSPKKVVGFMMGVWFLSSAFAFRIVGAVGKLLAVGGSADEINAQASLAVYTEGFESIAFVVLSCAALAFVLAPLMKKMMHGIH